MAIILDEENKVVTVENQPDAPRALFKNLPEAGTIESGVGDVLINGVSIVDEHGDADIPVASSTTLGAVKVSSNRGIQIFSGENEGTLAIRGAALNDVKPAANAYFPIVPNIQHAAAFFGLAKAAGDTTQALSDNVVGNYTAEAKIAIQKMLGIYEAPWELLNDITFQSESTISLTADDNGVPYNLKGVFIAVWYNPDTPTASTGFGRYSLFDDSEHYVLAETGKYPTGSTTKAKFIYLMRSSNFSLLPYSQANAIGGDLTWLLKYPTGLSFTLGNITRISLNAADVEPEGTRMQIYGQRAY